MQVWSETLARRVGGNGKEEKEPLRLLDNCIRKSFAPQVSARYHVHRRAAVSMAPVHSTFEEGA